jgi:hypothetical protein
MTHKKSESGGDSLVQLILIAPSEIRFWRMRVAAVHSIQIGDLKTGFS